MELKVIECPQYVLNERINEFEQDHKIKHITYLFKNPNILSVIEYTTTKEHKKQLAKEEKKEKIEEQQKEATQYLR